MARGKGSVDDAPSNVVEDEELAKTCHRHDVDDTIIHEEKNGVSETSDEEDENHEHSNEVLGNNDSEDEINEDNNEDNNEVGNDSNVANKNVVLPQGMSQDNMFYTRCAHNINNKIFHDDSRMNPNTHVVIVTPPRTLVGNEPTLKNAENVKEEIQKLNHFF